MTDKSIQYGLWEEGKRIKTFSEEQANNIQDKQIDYRAWFLYEANQQGEKKCMFDGSFMKVYLTALM